METQNVNARINYAKMEKGEFITISGREVNRIRKVRVSEISQMRAPENDPTGAKVATSVNQGHFSVGGRSFTITGDDANMNLLLGTINKTNKDKNLEVVEVYLIANEYRKPVVNEEGNIQYEDDGVTPILSDTVTQTWTFDGLTTASQDMAQETRDMEKLALRNKANAANVDLKQLAKLLIEEQQPA